MRNNWTCLWMMILLLMLSATDIRAQVVLHGRVWEIIEPYSLVPLPHVEIVVVGAGSTSTDTDGSFHLTFPLGKVGDKVKVRQLKLAGYELVSSFFMDQWYVSLRDTMDIYMACEESFKRLRDQFCCHNSAAYRRQQERMDSVEVAFDDSCSIVYSIYGDSLVRMHEAHLVEMRTVEPYLKQYGDVNVDVIRQTDDIDELLGILNQQQAEADRLKKAAETLSGKVLTEVK